MIWRLINHLMDGHSPFSDRRAVLPLHKKVRWQGRRWYDPNWWKMVLTTGCICLVATVVRVSIYAYSEDLKAAPLPAHGVIGSPHDLSAHGPYQITNESDCCIFCHSPHGAASGSGQLIPAWNHATTEAVFTMYASPSLKGAMDAQPTGPSLACLSCHDGTLAVGTLHEEPVDVTAISYATAKGGVNPGTGVMVGRGVTGTNMGSVHPIAITYQDDLVPTLRPPDQLVGVKLYPSNRRGAKVHCGSCHDPHNFGTADTAPFLRVSKAGSALCLACHKI